MQSLVSSIAASGSKDESATLRGEDFRRESPFFLIPEQEFCQVRSLLWVQHPIKCWHG
jgi:hypothetical protein